MLACENTSPRASSAFCPGRAGASTPRGSRRSAPDPHDPELFHVLHRGVGSVDQADVPVELFLVVPGQPKDEACLPTGKRFHEKTGGGSVGH